MQLTATAPAELHSPMRLPKHPSRWIFLLGAAFGALYTLATLAIAGCWRELPGMCVALFGALNLPSAFVVDVVTERLLGVSPGLPTLYVLVGAVNAGLFGGLALLVRRWRAPGFLLLGAAFGALYTLATIAFEGCWGEVQGMCGVMFGALNLPAVVIVGVVAKYVLGLSVSMTASYVLVGLVNACLFAGLVSLLRRLRAPGFLIVVAVTAVGAACIALLPDIYFALV